MIMGTIRGDEGSGDDSKLLDTYVVNKRKRHLSRQWGFIKGSRSLYTSIRVLRTVLTMPSGGEVSSWRYVDKC